VIASVSELAIVEKKSSGGEALVVYQGDSGASAAFRADRTPPEVVRSVRELSELGDPAALGEAGRLAEAMVAECESRRAAQVASVLATRASSQEEGIRKRFIDLVHTMIRSECARARARDEPLSAPDAWADLLEDDAGWVYAEAVRQTLGIDDADLYPSVSDRDRPVLTRGQGWEQLKALVDEWKALTG